MNICGALEYRLKDAGYPLQPNERIETNDVIVENKSKKVIYLAMSSGEVEVNKLKYYN